MSPNEKKLLFKKIYGAENYKYQNQNMIFALQDVKLWDYIMGFIRKPPELKEISNDNKDKKKCIYQQ